MTNHGINQTEFPLKGWYMKEAVNAVIDLVDVLDNVGKYTFEIFL